MRFCCHNQGNMAKLALIDDHIIFRRTLASFLTNWKGYQIVMEAGNGTELKLALPFTSLPDLVILDINMPEMNGFDTAALLLHRYPGMKILIVSMLPETHHLEKCLQLGICGYIQKDANIEELQQAIEQILQKGYYVNPASCIHLLSKRTVQEEITAVAAQQAAALTDREKEFLTWLCTDKGYKEIAQQMYVSPRTIDGYRDALLKKLKVASRIGLVTFAIRQGIVELP